MKQLTLKELLTAVGGWISSTHSTRDILGVSIDSRSLSAGDAFFAIKGRQFDGHDFVKEALRKGASYAVISDVLRLAKEPDRGRLVTVDDTVAALGRCAAHYRGQIAATVIAVTGSNGKTTTKAMIEHILCAYKRGRAASKSYNNMIGVPLTLLSAESDDEYLVVEVGTNRPGEIAHLSAMVRPDIAVICSIGAAHLEGLDNLEGVVKEKLSLLEHLKPRGLAVINVDSPLLRRHLPQAPAFKLVTTGISEAADLRACGLRTDGESIAFSISNGLAVNMPIPGRHNAGNALAAYAVARQFGITSEQTIARLGSFELPEMRLQMQQCGSIKIINDCYNANMPSMRAAINVLMSVNPAGRRVAIVGDMRELGSHAQSMHEQLGRLIAESNIDVLVSIGQHAQVVCDSARSAGRGRLELYVSHSVDHLSKQINGLLKPNDTVLLKASRGLGLERLVSTISRS